MIQRLLDQLEGPDFYVKVAVASGLRQFAHLLVAQREVTALVHAVRNDPEVAQTVLKRLIQLSRLRIDLRYESPYDASIAAYLVVLSITSRRLYEIATHAVLSSQNLWWSTQLLRSNQEESRSSSHAERLVIGNADSVTRPSGSFEATFPSGFLVQEAVRRFFDGSSNSAQSTQRRDNESVESIQIVSGSDSQYAFAA